MRRQTSVYLQLRSRSSASSETSAEVMRSPLTGAPLRKSRMAASEKTRSLTVRAKSRKSAATASSYSCLESTDLSGASAKAKVAAMRRYTRKTAAPDLRSMAAARR